MKRLVISEQVLFFFSLPFFIYLKMELAVKNCCKCWNYNFHHLGNYLDQNNQNIIIPSEKCLEHFSLLGPFFYVYVDRDVYGLISFNFEAKNYLIQSLKEHMFDLVCFFKKNKKSISILNKWDEKCEVIFNTYKVIVT